MERGLSILWIDAVCGSVQNAMTPPESNAVRRIGKSPAPDPDSEAERRQSDGGPGRRPGTRRLGCNGTNCTAGYDADGQPALCATLNSQIAQPPRRRWHQSSTGTPVIAPSLTPRSTIDA